MARAFIPLLAFVGLTAIALTIFGGWSWLLTRLNRGAAIREEQDTILKIYQHAFTDMLDDPITPSENRSRMTLAADDIVLVREGNTRRIPLDRRK